MPAGLEFFLQIVIGRYDRSRELTETPWRAKPLSDASWGIDPLLDRLVYDEVVAAELGV
jgi:hypothetical protein